MNKRNIENKTLLDSKCEPLIFEKDSPGASGIDIQVPYLKEDRLGGLNRKGSIGLPELSEPEIVRHYTRVSQMNCSIDTTFYPLGSCTMKYNPRLNEKLARLSGLSDIHPFQPESTIQGAYQLIDTLAKWLKILTGLPAVALSPAAGAHGELCGMMAIKAAHNAKNQTNRNTVLVPDSAHGTNPATASICGYKIETIPSEDNGQINKKALLKRLDSDVAAVMITNPNTCGLFEEAALSLAADIHAAGAYFYMDGANFNAIVGQVTMADLGVDAMHINLHKTFSTPHGGGGPGAGPTVLSEALAPFAPVPFLRTNEDGTFKMIEHAGREGATESFGRLKGFQGQFGVYIRALSYILSLGIDGLRQVSSDAVLNANYLRVQLSQELTPAYNSMCMHEVLFNDSFLKDTGITTLDFSKALIDLGYHPPTIYFPLVVSGALLIEPTETESKATLDKFIEDILALARKAKSGKSKQFFKNSPMSAPRRRLDESKAARHPVLRWYKHNAKQAAE